MQQDPLELTKKIIACESVTPSDAGSLKIFADLLSQHGFSCEEINRGQTKNLWAKYGSGAPVFLFAGHVDVVPPGADGWKFPPFVPTEDEGFLYGRGAQDMFLNIPNSKERLSCCSQATKKATAKTALNMRFRFCRTVR